MKKTILYLILLISNNCIAQDSTAIKQDSTAIKLNQMKQGIIYMRDNLYQCHEQFKTGLLESFIGSAFITTGVLLEADPNKSNYDSAKDLKNAAIIIGGIIGLFGVATMIDSHKYIKRAGDWKFEGNAITYNF